jgi:hypothetical protein
MKPKRVVTSTLGITLIVLGLYFVIQKKFGGFIPSAIGVSLVYLGYKPGRIAVLVFGHICVVVGCFLVTW